MARSEEEYWFYLNWLGDYLYRPASFAPLSAKEPGLGLLDAEMDMVEMMWFRPLEAEYLPVIGVRHADYLFRPRISAILSRVHDRGERVRLLDDLYAEFNIDIRK